MRRTSVVFGGRCSKGGGVRYNPRMRSAIIVYNPAAGRFSVKPFIKSAVKELESEGWQVEAAETRSGVHTIELAKQAAAEKRDAGFAVGGDGTIGNVVNGLFGSETALGVLPAGTANVGGYEWGLNPFSWTRAWTLRMKAALLANAPIHAVDVGTCNQYSFMMWAGIGLDALTIHSMEPRVRLEKFFTVAEYTAKTIWNAAQWSGVQLRLWVDGQEVEGRFIVGVTTNIRPFLGGHFQNFPQAIFYIWLSRFMFFCGSQLW